MADTKLSALTALAGVDTADGDLYEVVDISDNTMAVSGTNKKQTRDELLTALETPAALIFARDNFR